MKRHTYIAILLLIYCKIYAFNQQGNRTIPQNGIIQYENIKDTAININISDIPLIDISFTLNEVIVKELTSSFCKLEDDSLKRTLLQINIISGYSEELSPYNKEQFILNEEKRNDLYVLGKVILQNKVESYLLLVRQSFDISESNSLFLINLQHNKISSVIQVANYSVIEGDELFAQTIRKRNKYRYEEKVIHNRYYYDKYRLSKSEIREIERQDIYFDYFWLDESGYIYSFKK